MVDQPEVEDLWSEEHCRDVSFLEARCRELGLPRVEAALRQAAGMHGGVVTAIHGALRAEAHWLQRDPGALPARIYDRLRSAGWEEARIARELRFPAGLPALRLRHPTLLSDAEITMVGHEEGIWSCAVTPDGRRVISASRDCTLRVWDPRSGEELAVLRGHDSEVRDCAVMPDGRRIVSASSDKTLKVWDLETGRALVTLTGHQGRVLACAVSPDGRRVVSASGDRTLRIWDPDTRESLATLVGHEDQVRGCAVTPDGRRIVSQSGDGVVKIWSMETGEALAILQGLRERVRGDVHCAVSPDGKQVVALTGDGLRAWDLSTLEPLVTFHGSRQGVHSCAVTLDSRHLVASMGETILVWELATGKELAAMRAERFGHRDVVLCCASMPDGLHVVSASWDRSLRVWSLDAARAPAAGDQVVPHNFGVKQRSAATPDGQRVVSLNSQCGLQVWGLRSGELLGKFAAESPKGLSVMATGDHRVILQRDQALQAFELETGREVAHLVVDDARLVDRAVVRGDRWVVFCTPKDQGIHVWDLETGRTLTLAEAQRHGCVTTPAQRCALLDGSIVGWDEAGALRSTVAAPKDVETAWWGWRATPDGLHLCALDPDGPGQVHVLETRTGKTLASFVHPEPQLAYSFTFPSFAVTPDGRFVFTCNGTSICVWDRRTGHSIGLIHVERSIRSVVATNEVLCAQDRLGILWMFELPPRGDEASRETSAAPLAVT